MNPAPARRRLAVVGSVVVDTVVGGETAERLGGIVYGVAALAALAGGSLEIVPVARLGEDLWDSVRERLGSLPGVTTAGLIRHPGPNTRHELRYPAGPRADDRREILRQPLPPLTAEEVGAIRHCDRVLVNCITGTDCTVDALADLATVAPLHLDLHNRTLETTTGRPRRRRRPADWLAWAERATVLQCNAEEARVLCDDGAAALAAGLLTGSPTGPRMLLVSRGGEGAELYVRDDGRVQRVRRGAATVRVVDPTGAGDVLGAAFSLGRLRAGTPVEALELAVDAASRSCEVRGHEAVFERLA